MVKPEAVMPFTAAITLRGSDVSQVQNTFGFALKDCGNVTCVSTTVFAAGGVIDVIPAIIWGTLSYSARTSVYLIGYGKLFTPYLDPRAAFF